jgi:hypothetical protein
MFKLNTDYCLLRRHRVLKSGTGWSLKNSLVHPCLQDF